MTAKYAEPRGRPASPFLEERNAWLSNAIERSACMNASRIHAPSRLSIEQSEIDEFDREFMEEALPSGQSQVRLH